MLYSFVLALMYNFAMNGFRAPMTFATPVAMENSAPSAAPAVYLDRINTVNVAKSTIVEQDDSDGFGTKENNAEEISEEITNDTRTKLANTCKPFTVCYSESDCFGGRCMGSFVGTCNCNACLDLWLCESDEACGGLKGSCNNITKTCDCNAGYKAAGFPFFIDAVRGLCNRKSCDQNNNAERCYGLPCHFGRCSC
ncbi:hypothetical protein DICVIV_07237 [Dictyocaulus viviparus]|uniref:Chondroitin proteoglycan 3 n=1 Tax=Dictyocaulus viviparus TaxID=29172 RepID=A0A0D8XQ14_DICVI|nr:hypothetical protein DICVIV_07237 [Dictyocaulus viviparus]